VAVKAHYVAKDGGFLNGIPAADLDDDQYAALSAEQKRAVRSSGLYRMDDGDKKAASPPKDGE
jgi:hypothetical protein